MTNEDYISNQIAVYKNSKTLVEFLDKLRPAGINMPTSTQMVRKRQMAKSVTLLSGFL